MMNKNVDTIVNKVLKDFFNDFSPNDDTNQVNDDSQERNEDIEVLSQELIPVYSDTRLQRHPSTAA